jgi:hypothetical protein
VTTTDRVGVTEGNIQVGKRKRLKPLILKRVPRAATVVVHLESVFPRTPRR